VLQQTRVSTVIPYFTTWIQKWPTVHALAAASPADVLSAWKGLGYYSRATRLHEGAIAMTAQNKSPSICPIPNTPAALMNFPGIGRYTAGAVSSIAFGEPEAVLDGNVVRVLSRQLGVYADGKDKKVTDVLWEVAELLVKKVAGYPEVERSEVPGQWNQAVMELGSTICTPRPKCDECPIQRTCRAFAEGKILAQKRDVGPAVVDIEDACTLCEQLDTEDLVSAPELDDEEDGAEKVAEKVAKKRKVAPKASNTISNYFAVKTPNPINTSADNEAAEEDGAASPLHASKKRKALVAQTTSKTVLTYCSLFPKKVPKKKPAEEECAVCILELPQATGSSKYLIEQRPAKGTLLSLPNPRSSSSPIYNTVNEITPGLLASLWQFPQVALPVATDRATDRQTLAQEYLSGLDVGELDMADATHIAELGSLVHVFSHLRLTMHVHLFRIAPNKAERYCGESNLNVAGVPARKWVDAASMDGETLSTGMRRCWALISHE
jgi:A/G-specific adenine glycosylase